jgi:hypothetical protein
VVVTLAVTMRWRARKTRRSTASAGVLLAGIGFLPTQSGSISLLPAQEQLRAIEGLSTGLPLAVESAPYGNFLSPAGGLDPALAFGFSPVAVGLGEAQGVDPAIGSTLSDATERFGVGGSATGPSTMSGAVIPADTRNLCGQMPQQLQAFGNYWDHQLGGGPPVQLASNIATDPVQGSSGDPANLPWQGPAGAWCRPAPLPFAESSPLASRAFWTPVALVLSGVAVFWLSRGFKLPP